MKNQLRWVVVAWLLTAVFYFHQYMLRSAPAVMMPQLADAFGISALAVASLVGLFYYGYSPCSLIAGPALDRLGPKKVIPIGAAVVGVGALLFATGQDSVAAVGRFLQGAGGVVALVGAVTIASRSLSPALAGTLIGVTQMFGMAGGWVGQSAVGPLLTQGMAWDTFWIVMGIIGLGLSVFLFVIIPPQEPTPRRGNALSEATQALGKVFKNPQTVLCGIIAGLLFIPTTIFDMVWGVRYLQEGRGLEYGEAVMRSSMVPLGWIIGCPLLGFLSDRLGRRKPVILGGAGLLLLCLLWILFGPVDVLPSYVLGLLAGIASGAAMIPYTVSKESNPPELGGTATGVVTFVNFTFSALLGPVFARLLSRVSSGAHTMTLEHYQIGFEPLLYGVGLAMLLTLFLKETGPGRSGAPPG
jgi:MFS family permease